MEKRDIHPRLPFFGAALFLFLMIVIVAGALFYYRHEERLFKIKVQDELSAVSNLKMDQIAGWRKERLADAELLSRGGLLTLKNAPQKEIRDRLRLIGPMLAIYKKDFGYYSLIVTDAAGRVIENIGDTALAPLYVDTAAILRVVSEKKTRIVDFYRCPGCGRIHLDVIVPIFAGDTGRAVAGAVVLRRDPEQFLFPLVQTWPVPSRTSETLLFRREGDSIVYLNELRHRKGSALKLRLPLIRQYLPAARVVQGHTGFMEGTDYRGVKVFAVGRRIPDSPWYIIAKVDKEEIIAPLRAVGRAVLVVTGLFAAVLCSLLVMWWMAYDRRMLSARYREELARKQAEEGLRQSEKLYRSTLDTMMEGCQIIGFDWRYLYVNEVVAKQGRRPADEFVGRTMMECYPGIEATAMFEALRQCMKDRQPRQMENEFVYPDGATAYFQLAMQPNPEGVFILSLDITERKRAEEALRASEEKYRSMIVDLSEGFYSVTLDGKLLDHNREFKRILGFGLDENLIGVQLPDFWQDPEDRKAYLDELKKHGRLRNHPIAAKKKNRERIFVEANARIVVDQRGIPARIEGSFVDVTHRKQAEDKIKQLNNELLLKNDELEQLIYIASHDLRSPLVNVQGFSKEMGVLTNELAEIVSHAGLLEKERRRLADIVSKEFPEAQNYVLASVIKMDALLKGLLKLSRLGRASVSLQKIDMDEMVSSVLKTLEFQIQKSKARVDLAALPACTGDPDQVDQVFTNLIDNAVKYLGTDRTGVILITGKIVKDGFAEYCIEDNGIGIAPEHQPRAFEIFHRLNPMLCEGEGLGLAIVKKIVQRLNGSVRLESEIGKGSRFFVCLPGA